MIIDVRDDTSGITIIKLDGRLDIAGAGEVDSKFNVISGLKSKIVVDMSGVDFLASLGMRTLVTGAKAVSRHGGRFILAGAQPNVVKALSSAGLDTVLELAPDLPTALDRIG